MSRRHYIISGDDVVLARQRKERTVPSNNAAAAADGLIGIAEAARRLGMPPSTLHRAAYGRGIVPAPSVRVGRRDYYPPDGYAALVAAVDEHRGRGFLLPTAAPKGGDR